MKDLFCGNLVRLSAVPPEVTAKALVQWNQDSEMRRLANSEPAQLWSNKKLAQFIEKKTENTSTLFSFSICTLTENQLIGFESLYIESWAAGEAWLGIIIADRDYWGRGYGTDAARLIVQYGFLELNLRRISLDLHSYNERAYKSYQKIGFQLEGRTRGSGLRDGVRYDNLSMGILREEWLALQSPDKGSAVEAQEAR